MADGTLSLEDAFLIERAESHARILGLEGSDADRFKRALRSYHAGRINTKQLMAAMEKTDGDC
jgi:hypothetical protein